MGRPQIVMIKHVVTANIALRSADYMRLLLPLVKRGLPLAVVYRMEFK